jgi:flagellar assembly factor FliW
MTSATVPDALNGRIQTRFGEFDVVQTQVVTFPEGIPGFGTCRHFVLIQADELSPLACLQSMDAPYPSFLAADPSTLCADYSPELPSPDRAALGDATVSPLWLVILTLGLHEVTANLRAPIAINPGTMTGRQVLLDDPTYPVSWPVQGK